MPGGMSGLQIREGPIDGLWWVRLPFSSAIRLFRSSRTHDAHHIAHHFVLKRALLLDVEMADILHA